MGNISSDGWFPFSSAASRGATKFRVKTPAAAGVFTLGKKVGSNSFGDEIKLEKVNRARLDFMAKNRPARVGPGGPAGPA